MMKDNAAEIAFWKGVKIVCIFSSILCFSMFFLSLLSAVAGSSATKPPDAKPKVIEQPAKEPEVETLSA